MGDDMLDGMSAQQVTHTPQMHGARDGDEPRAFVLREGRRQLALLDGVESARIKQQSLRRHTFIAKLCSVELQL